MSAENVVWTYGAVITIREKIRAGLKIYAKGLFKYACRVAYGNHLNRLRRQRSKPEYQLDLIVSTKDGEYVMQFPHAASGPNQDTQLLLNEVLELLDEREKQMFELQRLGHKDLAIAGQIGVTVQNLRVIRLAPHTSLAAQTSCDEETPGRASVTGTGGDHERFRTGVLAHNK